MREGTEEGLRERHCTPCEGGTPPLGEEETSRLLAGLEGWTREAGAITRLFRFKNYGQTIGFVNAVAWIARREKHHPDLVVGYDTCRVTYITHAIGGLSENDFICAAKVNALLG